MNIVQCKSFLKLVETKNFTKASQELFISKQGLSRSIRSLEDELNTSLFVRTAYGVELSPAGRKILPELRAIVQSYDKIQDKLTTPDLDHLRILLSYGFFSSIPSDIIFSFLEQDKRLHFHYSCCNSFELEQTLVSEGLDLAFSSNPKRYDQFQYFFLFKNYHCFLVHEDHPLAGKKFIDIQDLDGIQIAISAAREYYDYDYIYKRFKARRLELNTFPCYESSTLLQFAEENRGVSYTTTSLSPFRPGSHIQRVFLKDYQAAAYDINIIAPCGQVLSKPAAEFICHCQSYCKKILEQRPNFPIDS